MSVFSDDSVVVVREGVPILDLQNLDITALNFDVLPDGVVYGKVLRTNISAGSILLSESVGSLDDIADGTSFSKVKSTYIESGRIVLIDSWQYEDTTEIHGGVIRTGTLYGNAVRADSKVTVGTGNNIAVLDGSDATYRLYVGHNTPSSAPFSVKQDGSATIATSPGAIERVEIKSSTNDINFYDDGNNLRVDLGAISDDSCFEYGINLFNGSILSEITSAALDLSGGRSAIRAAVYDIGAGQDIYLYGAYAGDDASSTWGDVTSGNLRGISGQILNTNTTGLAGTYGAFIETGGYNQSAGSRYTGKVYSLWLDAACFNATRSDVCGLIIQANANVSTKTLYSVTGTDAGDGCASGIILYAGAAVGTGNAHAILIRDDWTVLGSGRAYAISSESSAVSYFAASIGIKNDNPIYEVDVTGTVRSTVKVITPEIKTASGDITIDPAGGYVRVDGSITINDSGYIAPTSDSDLMRLSSGLVRIAGDLVVGTGSDIGCIADPDLITMNSGEAIVNGQFYVNQASTTLGEYALGINQADTDQPVIAFVITEKVAPAGAITGSIQVTINGNTRYIPYYTT